jgi:tetratricopeptide (TPR) repeat protein
VPVESHPSGVGSGPYGVAITPNGTKVYATNYNDKTVHLKSDEANTNLVPIDTINSPNSSKAWNNKGVALGKSGKFDEAIKAYDKAIEINPQISETWNNKGIDLSLSGKSDEAIKAYDQAIEINPNNSDA